ncbi:MAG: DUF1013 domain-containing protein [Rhizobiaceae bacterium]|jgi:hypothetical protein|nr:DUF1013 domain-containing protein [Rhizobiaceae bacterium]
MANLPLMPKATAVWLVDNTALSFEQIAEFCGMHVLEIAAIADGEFAQGIRGMDPTGNGQLTRDEIRRCENDPNAKLRLADPKVRIPQGSKRKGPRYTPVTKRHDRPNAILWMVRNHPELKDSQIGKLLGTTKSTIQQVRERTHWNSSNLTPMDPVALGLCTQIELDAAVRKASKDAPRVADAGATLLPAAQTQILETPAPKPREDDEELDADSVFAKLKSLKGKVEDDDDEE